MTARPPDPPGGQDPDPPNVRLAVRAIVRFLDDVDHDGALAGHDRLRERGAALRRAFIRLRDHLDHEGDDDGRE